MRGAAAGEFVSLLAHRFSVVAASSIRKVFIFIFLVLERSIY